MLPPVLSGFAVVREVWPGSCSRPLVLSDTLGARDDVRESIDRLWELFEFTAAAAAVDDHTPQQLGHHVPDSYRPQGLHRGADLRAAAGVGLLCSSAATGLCWTLACTSGRALRRTPGRSSPLSSTKAARYRQGGH